MQELERRKEEILEEFLEISYQKKHDHIELVKADCKKNKIPRETEKKKITDMQALMDVKRKDGMKEVKKKLNLILENDEISLNDKIERLQDTEQIRAFILAYFDSNWQILQIIKIIQIKNEKGACTR